MKHDLCESAKKGRRCGDDLCYGTDVTLCGFDLDLYREITDEYEGCSQDDSDDDFGEPSTTYGGIPRTAEPPQPSVQGEQERIATEAIESSAEQFQSNYKYLREVPSDVLASRIVGQLILQKGNLNKYQLVLQNLIDKYRAEESAPSITSERIAEIANEPTPCSTYVSATKYRIEKALREAGVRVG